MPPDALPPDFDGWDKEPHVPDHPLGTISAIDYDTGLPIVKRKPATAAQPATAVPATEQPAQPKPADTAQPATKPKLQPAFTKGQQVRLPDGSTGKIAHMVANMKTARVKTDDGKNITVRHDTLAPADHVVVKSHVRRLPGS